MTRLILALNRVFRPPRVKGRESVESYAEWEYEWGRDLVREYLEPSGDLAGKKVLDVGCGYGGKTVAYGDAGANVVCGVDVRVENITASIRFALSKNGDFRWAFLVGDAAMLALTEGAFDTVIANDAMEHFAEPEVAVRELARVTRRGGVIWIFFTPHFSPLGSHLYDYIYTPWCHLLWRRSTLESAIRAILSQRDPDRDPAKIDERVRAIMNSYDEDLNHMSIRRFFRIVRGHEGLRVSMVDLKPPKFGFLKALTKVPLLRELFTGTVVCRLERV